MLFKPEEFENAGFARFRVGGKYFENEAFQKR